MLAQRLVQLIESHSNELAVSLVDRLRNSSRTVSYLKIPADDLRQNAFDIYHHLGDWLMNKTETDVEYKFSRVGIDRYDQGIPLSDFIWALVITKENLWRFLQLQSVDRIYELFGELELIQLIDQFFDRALYYSTLGYERRAGEHTHTRAA